jgi:hypothetical protein
LARLEERRYVEDVHRLVPGIALLLAYAIAPGAGELTENVAHFLLDGHAAHAQHLEDETAPDRDTHGCSGPFQTCPCHGTTAFVADSGRPDIGITACEIATPEWFVTSLEAVGVLTGVFRPPIS